MRHALFIRATTPLLLVVALVGVCQFSFLTPTAFARAMSVITVSPCDETHLNSAIASAHNGDTITFNCNGGSGDIKLTNTLQFPPQANPSLTNLTIDGGGQAVQLDGQNNVQVFTVNTGMTLTLKRLTVTKGSSDVGGGIDNNGGTVTFSNSTVFNNSASNGGGIFNTNSGMMTISNSTISNNSISNSGGGVFNDYSSTVTFSNSTISNNTGPNSGFYDDGGGIFNHGTVTFSNSTISSNSINFGGGIFNADSGTMTINQSTVANNSSASSGGGIYNGDGSTLTISQSTFANNSAIEGGGIWNAGTLTFSTGTIANNTVTGSTGGGGIINYTTPSFSSIATISNSTVANNSAIGSGGGIVNLGGTIGIAQSIVANNGSSNCAGPITDQGYNLESGSDCGLSGPTDHQNTPPQFQGGLQNNGGPTQTIALQPTSPAVDRIPVNTGHGCITGGTDQRGRLRPDHVLLLLPEATCDIGAYEVQDLL